MSVAFRRESDEEHLEPKFELPIPVGPNLVTARGLALIQAQVAALEAAVAAPALDAETLAKARRELRYWRTRLATAQIMPAPDGAQVAFGCTAIFVHNGKERRITLVGDDEADPAAGLLSFSAPLARALMDAEVGDIVPFGGKADAIELLEIQVPAAA